jgi:hypothetical protein
VDTAVGGSFRPGENSSATTGLTGVSLTGLSLT